MLLLKELTPPPVGPGRATIDLEARIKVRVGGIEPTLTYKQINVSGLL